MKSLPLASLALFLALTGCSSSPTIERDTQEEVKLIGYELCLKTQQEYFSGLGYEGEALEKLVLQVCADKPYRP
ncbi:MAG: hypothetical protein FJW46_06190 [Actinobacteria bacterium]|nr:hypothetical protein [Actinomycetota bacterium]